MMQGENLFEFADRAPHSNETTSKEAAASVVSDVKRIAHRIYDRIAENPSTCEEIEHATAYSHQTVSARIRALVLDGRVEDSGDKRPTLSGRRAIVWRSK